MLIGLIVAVSAVVVFVAVTFNVISVYGNRIEKISLGGETFRVEIVKSPQKRMRGLGRRKSLCENCGMLFVFSKEGRHNFWMKDMEFPLDILWLENGKVVWIEKNISENSEEIFSPPVYSDMVLELNSGIVDKIEIKEGDKITQNPASTTVS